MSFSLDNYTTVAERIVQFYKDYPAGTISTTPAKTVMLGDATFISVIARIYLDRNMESFSTEAEAWEPFPGKTPYTRDSEMMNAATSAIGRALMQLGIGITEAGAASRDEVQVAQERRSEQPKWEGKHSSGTVNGSKPATERQVAAVCATLKKRGIDQPFWEIALTALIGRPVNAPEALYMGEVDLVLKDGGSKLQAAYFATMDLEIVSTPTYSKQQGDLPKDDLWAGENV